MPESLKRISLTILLMAVTIGLHLSAAMGQDEWKAGDTGVTTGTVSAITDEYVLVKATGDAPRRHWFKWVEQADAKPDPALQSEAARVKTGDAVEVHWSFDDRRRIESLKLTTLPRATPAPQQPLPSIGVAGSTSRPSATTMAASLSSPTKATGDAVNNLIDDALATAYRVLQFPLFVLLSIVSIPGLMLATLIRRAKDQARKRVLLIAEGVFGVLAIAFIVDRKIALLESQVDNLHSQLNANTTSLLAAISSHEGSRQSFLFDADQTHRNLAAIFGDVSVRPLVYDKATDIVQAHLNNPLAQAYLAVVDLQNPDVEIKIGGTPQGKTLTSDFARASNCTVAINGEAGTSPAPGSGLGVWRGNMVSQGQVIFQENAGIPRPFLSFDRQNHVAFTPAGSRDRAVSSDNYNVIWGRLDALVNGQVQSDGSRDRQPRTAMAVNRDGTRLFLLVVDGRQPRYSMGLSRAEVGQFLKAFGAQDGMLCDEGGSSCIYLKQFGGISNVPSDNQGQERPTYTHFGIALRAGQ